MDDIYVHDRQTGETTRVSVASDGGEVDNSSGEPSISPDGRFMVFQSAASNLIEGDANGTIDIFLHDLETNTTIRVSVDWGGLEANLNSGYSSVSKNGCFIVFESWADYLVVGDTHSKPDIFVHDRELESCAFSIPVFLPMVVR